MRVYDPNHKPSKEFIESWDRVLKKPIQQSTDPRDKPCFITEEMEKELLAKGETWVSEPPPGVQRYIDRNKNKE